MQNEIRDLEQKMERKDYLFDGLEVLNLDDFEMEKVAYRNSTENNIN